MTPFTVAGDVEGWESAYRTLPPVSAMTKSQINKLGERLRASASPDDDNLDLLQRFRELYSVPLASAQALLRDRLGLEATARLKTTNTIVEKLRRERTRLAEMQDIAGIRIVSEMGLTQQDEMVTSIVALFPGARIVDRRARPSHGYRAAHVIPLVEGRLVEIQIRTKLQDHWAQAMEKLADKEGRDIRYGALPDACADRVRELQEISRSVAELEMLIAELAEAERRLKSPRKASSGQREALLYRLRLQRMRARAGEIAQRIRGRLNSLY